MLFMGKLTISTGSMFNSYVKLPEGNNGYKVVPQNVMWMLVYKP